MIEGLIVFPLVLTVIITFVEFGYAVFQWSQTGKAVAVGARLAAVSTPVAPGYATLDDDYVSSSTLLAGEPVPAATVSTSCAIASRGAGETYSICNSDALRFIRGSDGVCNPNYGTGVAGMCDLNPRIEGKNVIVTYTRAGLGYVGRVSGPVPTVTVQTRDIPFYFFFVGALFGLNRIDMPVSPVTVTGEDMASCANPATTATSFSTPCP
nr:TadE/TadG family type IV pilus assembly protein [Gemmobacter straminiformis]